MQETAFKFTFDPRFVVLCAVVHFGLSLGVPFSLSVMFLDWQDSFGTSRARTATVHSACVGILFAGGLIPGYLMSRFGGRPTMLLGVVFTSTGLFASAFVPSIELLTCTAGAMTGLGFCLLQVPVMPYASLTIPSKSSLVISLCSVGTAIASLSLPNLYRALVELYSWRGACIILSGISLNLCTTSLILSSTISRASRTLYVSEGLSPQNVDAEEGLDKTRREDCNEGDENEDTEKFRESVDGHSADEDILLYPSLNDTVHQNNDSVDIIPHNNSIDIVHHNNDGVDIVRYNNDSVDVVPHNNSIDIVHYNNDGINIVPHNNLNLHIGANSYQKSVHIDEPELQHLRGKSPCDLLLPEDNIQPDGDENNAQLRQTRTCEDWKQGAASRNVLHRIRKSGWKFILDPMFLSLFLNTSLPCISAVSILSMDVAKNKGLPETTGVHLIMVLYTSSICGRLFIGTIALIPGVHSYHVIPIFTFTGAVHLLALAEATRYGAVVAAVAVGGLALGGLVAGYPKYFLDLHTVDVSSYPVAIGLGNMGEGVFNLICPVLIGYAVDSSGSYALPLRILGSLSLAASIILVIVIYLHRHKRGNYNSENSNMAA